MIEFEKFTESSIRALCALSAAESLTDTVAKEICELVPVEGIEAENFVRALRQCNFVIPRNNEWCFSYGMRAELRRMAGPRSESTAKVHKFLLDQSRQLREDLPSYLCTRAGQAYHSAAVGLVPKSLELYSEIAKGPPSGEQWLASIFAVEQQEEHLLPDDAIEPAFLRGMTLYNEKDFEKAETYLRKVISSGSERIEVAIALHIVGILEGRKGDYPEALKLFDRSVSLSERLRDHHGLAMVLNSRGCAKRNLRDPEGAIRDLSRAIDLGSAATAAGALNSRASVKRDLNDLEGALEDLNRAAEIGDDLTLAMVLNSRSVIKRDLGDLDGAIHAIDELFKMDKGIVAGVVNFGALTERRAVLQKERKLLEKAATASERQALLSKFLFKIAKNYFRNYPELHRAISLFHRIRALDPGGELDGKCLYRLGAGYLKLDRIQEAIPYFESAIQAGEESSELLASYAFALVQSGAPSEQTHPLFERAISLDGNNTWAKSWFALALSDNNEHDRAETHAREAVDKMSQPNPALLINLARVLDATNDPQKRAEAIEVAKQAAKCSFPTFTLPKQFLSERGLKPDD